MECSYLDSNLSYYPYLPNINTTLPVYIAQAVVLSVVFPLSFVGTVLNIVFICRRKTNFLVRRIVYMTVITTLQLGVLWLWSIPAFKPDESMFNFCAKVQRVYFSIAQSGVVWTMAILVCSINFTLVTKLCGCFSRRRPWSDRSRFLLECIFVTITLLVGLVFSVLGYFTYFTAAVDTPLTTGRGAQQIITLAIPPAIVLISLMGNVVLTIWFCTLWRRQIARRRDVLKEIGIFFALFFFTLFVLGMDIFTIFYFITPVVITQIVISPLLSCFPLLVFGYMCYSFRSRTRHVRFANRADIETAGPGLRTAPPSTRVSLPTDTADHAPNFLSPSTAELSEVTLLMN